MESKRERQRNHPLISLPQLIAVKKSDHNHISFGHGLLESGHKISHSLLGNSVSHSPGWNDLM